MKGQVHYYPKPQFAQQNWGVTEVDDKGSVSASDATLLVLMDIRFYLRDLRAYALEQSRALEALAKDARRRNRLAKERAKRRRAK